MALPAMEVAALPQVPLQPKGKKNSLVTNVQIPYGFAILLGTSSPCMFEPPCFRITRHFMPINCGAYCLLWGATHMARSQSLFPAERSFYQEQGMQLQ